MPFADIVKVSEEELVFLTGETELRRGAAVLYARFPMKALLLHPRSQRRPGPGRGRDHCPDGLPVKTVDTTAAGGFLYRGIHYPPAGGRDGYRLPLQRDAHPYIGFCEHGRGFDHHPRKGAICALPHQGRGGAQYGLESVNTRKDDIHEQQKKPTLTVYI